MAVNSVADLSAALDAYTMRWAERASQFAGSAKYRQTAPRRSMRRFSAVGCAADRMLRDGAT